jgi:hypothetical protein
VVFLGRREDRPAVALSEPVRASGRSAATVAWFPLDLPRAAGEASTFSREVPEMAWRRGFGEQAGGDGVDQPDREGGTMSDLYDTDIVEWSERQAALLRRLGRGERINSDELDWPHIAEEIEDVGWEKV